MPYIHIQYSSNLEKLFDARALLEGVHDAATRSGMFDPPAIRSMAERRDMVVMGDGNPDNGFVLIVLRVRKGRDEATRTELAAAILETASAHLDGCFDGRSMALNVEVQEIGGIGQRRHELRRP